MFLLNYSCDSADCGRDLLLYWTLYYVWWYEYMLNQGWIVIVIGFQIIPILVGLFIVNILGALVDANWRTLMMGDGRDDLALGGGEGEQVDAHVWFTEWLIWTMLMSSKILRILFALMMRLGGGGHLFLLLSTHMFKIYMHTMNHADLDCNVPIPSPHHLVYGTSPPSHNHTSHEAYWSNSITSWSYGPWIGSPITTPFIASSNHPSTVHNIYIIIPSMLHPTSYPPSSSPSRSSCSTHSVSPST